MKPGLCYTFLDSREPRWTTALMKTSILDFICLDPKIQPFTLGHNENLRCLTSGQGLPVEALLYDAIYGDALSILDIFALYHAYVFGGKDIPHQVSVFIAEKLGSIAHDNKTFEDIIPEKELKKAQRSPPSPAISALIESIQNNNGKKIPLKNAYEGYDALTIASQRLAGHPWGMPERAAEEYVYTNLRPPAEFFPYYEGKYTPLHEGKLNERRIKQNKRKDRIFKMQELLDWFYGKSITTENLDRWNEQKDKIHALCKS